MSSSSSARYERARIPKSNFKAEPFVTGKSKQTYGELLMLIICNLKARCPSHSPTRFRLAIVAGAIMACVLFAGPIYAAAKASRPPRRHSVSSSPSRPKRR